MSIKNDSIVLKKAFDFGVQIVKMNASIITEKQFVLAKQVLRSGTSIGANINEALYGYSKKDFIFKMSIALKEAAETEYWLRLLQSAEVLQKNLNPMISETVELQKMLTAILNTSKRSGFA